MRPEEMLHSGELYRSNDPALVNRQQQYIELVCDYNLTRPSEAEKRQELLRRMFAEVGEGCWIEPPFHANFGGHFCHLGRGVYVNFNLTLVDDTHIYIGDRTLIGPNVTLATASHPFDPALRAEGYQSNSPIRIGRDCWLGAGVIVLPGVTIGDNVVIGAGSVVTHDIPSDSVAVGVPCRVIRHNPAHPDGPASAGEKAEHC